MFHFEWLKLNARTQNVLLVIGMLALVCGLFMMSRKNGEWSSQMKMRSALGFHESISDPVLAFTLARNVQQHLKVLGAPLAADTVAADMQVAKLNEDPQDAAANDRHVMVSLFCVDLVFIAGYVFLFFALISRLLDRQVYGKGWRAFYLWLVVVLALVDIAEYALSIRSLSKGHFYPALWYVGVVKWLLIYVFVVLLGRDILRTRRLGRPRALGGAWCLAALILLFSGAVGLLGVCTGVFGLRGLYGFALLMPTFQGVCMAVLPVLFAWRDYRVF